jgi:hypothetical protein
MLNVSTSAKNKLLILQAATKADRFPRLKVKSKGDC